METKTKVLREKREDPAGDGTSEARPIYGEEKEYIDRWALSRLPNSRGRVELLMVYVRNEENRGHNFDMPSVFEQAFTEFCDRRV